MTEKSPSQAEISFGESEPLACFVRLNHEHPKTEDLQVFFYILNSMEYP